ncbi:unnamed protein product [Rhizoctonia solani]|uniref:F-box domain-containing protein n=1 Tax=Rhizoctonia solani TaxID=456999 RepID=A0A8H2WCS0_9AGAM|nr:unnamed protein product [Rhizoctonia solani]
MSSSGSTSYASTEALSIPEVATLIIGSGDLSRADLANLQRVCRYMCEIATPLLWKNATAAGLLALIKSAITFCYNGRADNIFLDAEDAGDQNFERFHLYGQYIENLEIYDQESYRCYSLDGWHILEAELRARGRPLIPNLSALRFLNTSSSHGIDESRWIQIFAHPGLKEVSLMPNPPTPAGRIPFPVASLILEALVRYCPDIQILQLAPNDDQHYPATLHRKLFNVPLFRAALECQPPRPWYQAAQVLTRLQHLTISEGWLYPNSFQTLGSFPELESLAIVPGPLEGFDYEPDTNLVLLSGSFSKLINLSILGLEDWTIGTILEIQGLIRQITTMKLEFSFNGPHGDLGDHYCGLEKIFKGLRGASFLQELHISFPFELEEEGRPAEVYSMMEEMGLHPLLTTISLDGIRIDKEQRRTCDAIRGLSPIWPNARTLSMPSQHASLRDLVDFARLPSLRYLTVRLNLKYPYIPANSGFKAAPLKVLMSSGPVRLSTTYKDLCLSAR